jgi:membrane fusion protein, multidrug efflux system
VAVAPSGSAEGHPEQPQEAYPPAPPVTTAASPRRRRWWLWLLVLGGAAYALRPYLGQGLPQSSKSAEAPAVRAVPLVATAARQGSLGIYLTGLGSVTPFNTDTVRSRVDGQLVKVAFQEGQLVRKGELLAAIDPRPFQVQLAQAEGQLSRDAAQLKNAKLDLERNKILLGRELISKQEFDTQLALVNQYEGAIKSDQAQIDNAKLQLTYSRITAPISGRIGLRLVDERKWCTPPTPTVWP